jgi:excisionase family DNA binding protein
VFNSPINRNRAYTLEEACRHLGISRQKAYRWIKTGMMPVEVHRRGGLWYVRGGDLADAWRPEPDEDELMMVHARIRRVLVNDTLYALEALGDLYEWIRDREADLVASARRDGLSPEVIAKTLKRS